MEFLRAGLPKFCEEERTKAEGAGAKAVEGET